MRILQEIIQIQSKDTNMTIQGLQDKVYVQTTWTKNQFEIELWWIRSSIGIVMMESFYNSNVWAAL